MQRTAAAVVISRRIGGKAAAASRIIDASRARQLLDNKEAKFIDVRAPETYSEGNIPTAANIFTFVTYLATSDASGVRHLTDTFTEELRRAGVNGDEHVVTYENSLNTLYGASCRALYIMKLLGHPRVSVLGGGYEGWVQDGHPTTTEPRSIPRGNFQPNWNPSMWKGKADVLEALRDPNTVLLDVRHSIEWTGKSSVPDGVPFVTPRKGRLPGATHIHWTDFMEETDSGQVRFKPPEEIRAMCEAKGVTPDKEVVVYCLSGVRASNSYLALKEAGFENVSNYLPSWNEWSRDDELEIDSKLL